LVDRNNAWFASADDGFYFINRVLFTGCCFRGFLYHAIEKVSTVIKPLQLAAPGIPVEAKFKSNDGPSWKGVMGRIVLKAIVIVVIVCLIGYYLLLPLALGLIFGGLELLFTGRTTIFEGFFNR
jgi:hypothetical protein